MKYNFRLKHANVIHHITFISLTQVKNINKYH